MIIFNELEYAQYLLKHGFDKYMDSNELVVLARYFRHIGKNDEQIKEDLHQFCEKHVDEYDRDSYIKKIHFVLKIARKRELAIPQPVPITQKEIDCIRVLNDYRSEKVAFFLLVLAKHNYLNAGFNDYTAYLLETEVFSYAKVQIKKDEKREILKKLVHDNGLFLLKLSGTSKRLPLMPLIVDEESEPLFYIDDFGNIVKQYPVYCKKCGEQIEKKSPTHNYCDDCWKLVNKEIQKEQMRQKRGFYKNV